MKLSRRRIATILSVIYLTLLTALAAYALHQTHTLSLPIPNTLSTLTLALPPLAGLALETSNALSSSISKSRKHASRHASNIPAVLLPSTLTILGLVVYCTVIATLGGTHISPVGGLGCALRERWTQLFRAKEAARVQSIQDLLSCCGFHTVKEMAYPFPSGARGVGADECMRITGRTAACEDGWRDKERLVAGLMVGVAAGVFVWMAVIIATPAVHPSWARDTLRLPSRGAAGTDATAEDHERRVIEYNERYVDDPDVSEAERIDRRQEIEGLNSQSRLAMRVEGSRVVPSKLMRDENYRLREENHRPRGGFGDGED
ncbi:hypothetical protein MBLNU459_g8129t1 [Dothideomycetes sp. NU459]